MRVTNIALGKKYSKKVGMLQSLWRDYEERIRTLPQSDHWEFFADRDHLCLGTLDTKSKNGNGLTFKEAFQGMLLVISATNNIFRKMFFPKLSYAEAVAKGSYYLTMMAAKEAYVGLEAEEVAGMAAAGMMDLFFVPNLHMMFETCGMGADRGWGTKTVKTINASTLSAIVLAAMGLPTTKHGSYGNTTKIGSTDVLEQSGANVAIDGAEELMRIFKKTRFLFTDAHTVKTLHYLSHLLKVETVNHVIGPMTGPVSSSTRLYKLMGVNHNVHPLTVAGAYTELHREGFVNLGGAVIVGGVNAIPKREDLHSPTWFRDHCFLDEVSPVATIVCLATGPTVLGTVCLEGSAPFGVEFHEHDLKVPNEMHTLMQANQKALRGEGPLGNYLAANTALARMAGETEFFTLDRLRDYTEDALKVLQSGAAERLLDVYVEETGGTRIVW